MPTPVRTILVTFIVALAQASWGIDLDETPAEAGEWGYRPAEGTTVDRNPPGFSWRPVEGAAGYDLEIRQKGGAADGRLAFGKDDSRWPAFCPSISLEPGTYTWRYRASDENGNPSEWSQRRTFTIPGDAVYFPKPSRQDTTLRVPDEHPRLFLRPEEVLKFRTLGHGRLKEAKEDVLGRADNLIESPPDTSEPPKYPDDVERKSDEWKDIWWGNRRRTIAVADGAATLGFAYLLTGDERYSDAGRELLMALIGWDPKGSTQYEYNDEAAMPALYMTSRAYTWLYPTLSEAQRAKVAEVMAVRGADCFDHLRGRNHLWKPYASHSNRAWHFLGEVAIAFLGRIPEAEAWLDYAMTIFYTAYPVWSDSDGGWHEGTAYWTSYMSRFMYWAFVSKAAFDVDVFERPFFNKTGYYGMYAMPPGSDTGGFADQAPHRTSDRIARFLAVLGAGAGNSHWMWYAGQHDASLGSGYLGFIYRARSGSVSADAPAALPDSKVFRGTGLAFLNTNLLDGRDNTQIHFKSSPMGRQSHGYNANNAFLLNVDGERVLITSGRRDVHGSPHHKQYMWHSKSDNAILVNGEGQRKHSPSATGRITHFRTSDGVDVLAGEAAASYANLDRWTRRIVFIKPDLIVIHDLLEAPEASTYTWNLHAQHAFTLGDNTAGFEYDGNQLGVRFLEPAGLQLSQTDTFDVPPHDWANFELDEHHLSATTPDTAKRREFVTVIEPTTGTSAQVDMTKDGDKHVLRFALEGASGTVTLDDRSFAVEWQDTAWRFKDE